FSASLSLIGPHSSMVIAKPGISSIGSPFPNFLYAISISPTLIFCVLFVCDCIFDWLLSCNDKLEDVNGKGAGEVEYADLKLLYEIPSIKTKNDKTAKRDRNKICLYLTMAFFIEIC